MAVGEKRITNQISQVSWTDWTALDVYYWLDHSFQYSRNINCDDELHGIKLSTKAYFTNNFAKCQLTSLGENGVVALDVSGLNMPKYFNQYTFFSWADTWDQKAETSNKYNVTPWTVFQDYFWYCVTDASNNVAFKAVNVANIHSWWVSTPQDHPESTDESIEDPTTAWMNMSGYVTAVLNYNNSRLVVATSWTEAAVWVYYPELDTTNHSWATWWKKVWTYEAWVTIVWLTCSFEYLKVWAVDEWWNTQVYYYQGNNNLRNTFVYNLVDLKGVRVIRVYSINWIDYYVSSLDGTDGFVNLYKLVWDTPVQLFKRRAWLNELDVNTKAPYFVWPCGLDAAYAMWKFYIADSYGLFQFTYNPQWFDEGYMKWSLPHYNSETQKFEDVTKQVYWVCENQGYLYVSTEDWCYIMRVWDTWQPVPESKSGDVVTYKTEGYQEDWILISREFEWKEWGTVTKMLDEIRLNYEMNPNTPNNWTIEIYVSPNNLWKNTAPWTVSNDNWYKVMRITQTNAWTRTEKSSLFNDLNSWQSAFKFDWQTITYAIVITRDNTEPKATPIVRQIDIKYHCKDKVNKVYNIN